MSENAPKAIERDGNMSKHGSASDGTDSSHRMSVELFNHVSNHTPGAPASDDHKSEAASALNCEGNTRIKSAEGNRVTDRSNDARVMQHFDEGSMIDTKAAADRAQQAVKGATESAD